MFAYLEQTQPACILLGCTHFPVLKEAIQATVKHIPIVDPAQSLAQELITLLSNQHLQRASGKPITQFMATDGVERFARVAQTFLGHPITADDVELVTVIPKILSAKKAMG